MSAADDGSSAEVLTGGAATRQRIIEVAHTVIREVGIRRLTMRNVANRVEISRAALYRHFPDKTSLVDAVLIHNGHLVRTELERVLEGVDALGDKCVKAAQFGLVPPREVLILQLGRSDPEALAQLLTTDARPFLERATRFWKPHVEAARATGEIRDDLDAEAAAEWIARCLYGLAVTPSITFDRHAPKAIESYIRSFVMTGLGATPPKPSPPRRRNRR